MASEFPVDGQDSGFIELAVGLAEAVVLESDGSIGVEEIDAADEGAVGVVDAGLLEGGGEAGLEKGDLDIGFAGAFRESVDEADGGAGGFDAVGFGSVVDRVEEFVFGGEVGGEGEVAAADGFGKAVPAGDIDDRQGWGGKRNFKTADGGGAQIVPFKAGLAHACAGSSGADDVDLLALVDDHGHAPQGRR